MKTWFAALTVALAVSAAPVSAQDEVQEPAPVFRSSVSLVRVDVSVTDGDGQPLRGLRAADFEIIEDGVQQTIESVQFVELDGTRAANVDDSLEIRSPEHAAAEAARDDVRLFAIFLDDYHVSRNPETARRAKEVLTALVKQFGPNDLIAIMDPLTPLSALRFTRASDELLARIDAFEGRRGVFVPPRSAAEAEQLGRRNVGEIRAGVTLSALAALVNHLGGLREGRKSVLFVSEGPPVGLRTTPNEQLMRDVLQAANTGNVTLHVYDPQPLAFSGRAGRDVLQRLQRETGGRAFFNSNGTIEQVSRVIDDASAYYLLAYAPSREFSDGQFHEIQVRVRHDDARVVARNGYWAPTAEQMNAETVPPPAPELLSALSSLATPAAGRAVEVWLGESRGPGALTRLAVSWDPVDAGRTAPPVQLTVEPLDGQTLEAIGEPQALASATSNGDAPTVATFDIPPGASRALRFVATDADGGIIDRWTQPVTVAAYAGDELALSTARVFRATSAFAARALAAADNPAPSAVRRFRASDRVFVELDRYGTGADVVTEARLLNEGGDTLVELPVQAMADGRIRVTLPVSSLAPSTYILHVHASAGDRTVEQRVAFRIAN